MNDLRLCFTYTRYEWGSVFSKWMETCSNDESHVRWRLTIKRHIYILTVQNNFFRYVCKNNIDIEIRYWSTLLIVQFTFWLLLLSKRIINKWQRLHARTHSCLWRRHFIVKQRECALQEDLIVISNQPLPTKV